MMKKNALILIAHGSRDPKWVNRFQIMLEKIKVSFASTIDSFVFYGIGRAFVERPCHTFRT